MFMWLLFAHFIGDWGICNSWIQATKDKHLIVMTAHCMIYTACCIIALKLIGVGDLISWSLWIFISHFFIDYWKCKYAPTGDFPTWHLYIDQAAHIGILLGIVIFQTSNF